MGKLKSRNILCLFFLACMACDNSASRSFVEASEAARVYRDKVQCVAVLNYHPNVEGAKAPLQITPFLSRFSDYQFTVIARTKLKDNRPDFYKTFVSYQSCEKTKRRVLKSRKFGKCIISFEETSLSEYQSFFENGNREQESRGHTEAPLKCKA